ncbi:unnamed protein product [Caenorhabditis bovis]|uniref:Anaphase-promoting complex subunit 10 n=1 Tax=Caenorhabditis bovis TaxID=2654633 RepID=A0A8S1EF94_9PELO|nr:unnamed protein product [Caenorhabditis bovis]
MRRSQTYGESEDDDMSILRNPITRMAEMTIAAEKQSSSGWKYFIDDEKLIDVTHLGIITLSSVAVGYGVKELLDRSVGKYWKSNKAAPHTLFLEFQKVVDVAYVVIYLDYAHDESYCPEKIQIDMGWSSTNIFKTVTRTFEKPQGWQIFDMKDEKSHPTRGMLLTLTVLSNHEGGRDCTIRHFRAIGPEVSRFDPLVKLNSFKDDDDKFCDDTSILPFNIESNLR